MIKIDGASSMVNQALQTTREGAKATDKSFSEVLNNVINEVNETEQNSVSMVEKLATGEIDNVHEVFLAASKAELTLNMAIEVKNKLVEAYKEIMRLQL